MSIQTKKQYRAFCKNNPGDHIFSQDWWLDIVCGEKNWDVAIAKDKSGVPIGFLPYPFRKSKGMRMIMMPPLSPALKIAISTPKSINTNYKRYSHQQYVIEQLINQFPKHEYLSLSFPPEFDNWMPFFWKGFNQKTRYTYRLDMTKQHQYSIQSLRPDIRNKINKASKLFTVEVSSEVEMAYSIIHGTYSRQKMKTPFTLQLFQSIFKELKQRNKGLLLAARHANGKTAAICYLVQDGHTIYNLILSSTNVDRSSGAVQLLLWDAISRAASTKKTFDFEGSMIKGVEYMFRGYNGILTPYMQVYKSRNKLLSIGKSLLFD